MLMTNLILDPNNFTCGAMVIKTGNRMEDKNIKHK